MKFVTNGVFAVPLIPECRLYSIHQWAMANKFSIQEDNYQNLNFVIPYRNSYDRILRAIAADLHEVMLDNNIVNLNKQTWDSVKDVALPYIINWFDTVGHLPIKKDFCHTRYFTNYVNHDLPLNRILIDVVNINNITTYINSKYRLTVSNIPDHPAHFYDYTVPYWEIDTLYQTNENTRRLVDAWCKEDARLLSVHNLLVRT